MKLLITGMETFRRHVANIGTGLQYAQIEGEIRTATVEYMLPYLGQSFYESLAERLEWVADAEADDPDRILIEKLQAALANYVALKYTPISDTFFTSMGLQTMKSDTQTGAFAYQKADRMNKYAADADTLMDDALAYIAAHADVFPDWDYNGRYRHWAFFDAVEFSRFYGIGESRRTFLRLLPIIGRVDSLEILPVLGQERYRQLVQWREKGQGDNPEQLAEWFSFVQPALANLTMFRAIRELSFRPVSDAVQVASFFQPTRRDGTQVSLVDMVSERAKTDGNAFLNRLGTLLSGSDRYLEFDNSKDKKHFIM